MSTKIRQLLFLFILSNSIYAQQIVSGEYFFDVAPNQGSGTAISLSSGTDVSHSMTVPTTGLNPGFHYLYTRVKNDLNIWSHYQGRMLYVLEPLNTTVFQISEAEWFIDTDPGVGNGTNLPITAGTTVSGTLNLPNAMSPGFHYLYIRVRDDYGKWSHYQGRMFYVLEPISSITANISEAEYFFDTDPGLGNGTAFAINTPSSNVSQAINITESLTPGFHHLFIRVKNDLGKWSHYQGRMIYIQDQALNEVKNIVEAEYFVDSDTGIGTGTPIGIVGGTNILENINLNTSGIPLGTHHLFIRVKEDNGRWSHYAGRKFVVCNDVLASATITGVTEICQNSDLSLSGSTVTNATSYFWKGPNNFNQTGNNLSISNAQVSNSGTYKFYAVRVGGTACDTSLAEISINIKPVFSSSNPQIICEGSSYLINGNTYTVAGTYNDTLQAINGCDSIITTQLTILPTYTSNNQQSICDGGSYSFNGNTYSAAGFYNDTLQAMNGCDSVIVTQLIVNPVFNVSNSVDICDGDTYTVGSSVYSTAGTYTDVFQSINGCDSTIITNLTIKQNVQVNNPQVICEGETYVIGSSSYTLAGTYSDLLQTMEGCDSLVTTILTVNPVYSSNNPQVICQGETFVFNGNTYSSSGSYPNLFQSINGCDSTVTIQLTVNPTFTANNPQTICSGGSYSINGNTYTAAGTYTDIFQSVKGCDSTIVTQLSINSPVLNLSVATSDQTMTSNENNATYQWIDCLNNNSIISGETNKSFTASQNGQYAVILTSLTCNVVDTSACVIISNVGGVDLTTGFGIIIYPNPTNENFVIESENSLLKNVKIFNAEGKLIFEQNFTTNKATINATKWSDGVYWIELDTEKGVIHEKFVKLIR